MKSKAAKEVLAERVERAEGARAGALKAAGVGIETAATARQSDIKTRSKGKGKARAKGKEKDSKRLVLDPVSCPFCSILFCSVLVRFDLICCVLLFRFSVLFP